MKRGTIDHPKTLRLASALQIERWGAVGLLESLWHFVSAHAPEGDVGRWTNDEIAAAVHWSKGGDSLVDALVATHWLDTSKKHRLLVHDWPQHCDDSVKKKILYHKRDFARDSQRTAAKVRESPCKPSLANSHSLKPSLAKPLSCSEPENPASEQPDSEVVLTFDCVGESQPFFGLTQAKLDEYQASYPGIDALAECRKALQWIRDNPTRRKTYKGMPKFLSGWLGRSQDSGRPSGNGAPQLRPGVDPRIFQ